MTSTLPHPALADAMKDHWVLQVGLLVLGLGILLRLAAWGANYLQSRPKTPAALSRQAARALARGDATVAGDLYTQAQELGLALDAYRHAGNLVRAAETAATLGRRRVAAELYEQVGRAELAAEHWTLAGELAAAERCYVRANLHRKAGQMYEDAGRLGDAARIQEKMLNNPGRAALLYERMNRPLQAAELLTQKYWRQRSSRSPRYVQTATERHELEDRIATLYDEAGERSSLLRFLERAERYERAAEVALQLEQTDQAVKLFVKAGREDRAALVLDTAGQNLRAARLRGDQAHARRELHSAARHYETAGEIHLAAHVYEEIGDYKRAAETHEKAGDPGRAAHFYRRLGEFRKAAELYDLAGNVDQAVRCYETLGEHDRSAHLLEVAGRPFEAGQAYLKIGRLDDAVRCLQDVPSTSPSAGVAGALLGIAFFDKGEYRLARTKLEAAAAAGTTGKGPNATHAEIHYHLGRIYEGSGELSRAVGSFEQVLSLRFGYRDTADRLTALKEALSRPGLGPADVGQGLSLEGEITRPPSGFGDLNAELSDPPTKAMLDTGSFSVESIPVGPGNGSRYEILEELGRGGMGVVHKCHDTLLDRMVAYKVLGQQIRDFPQALDSFVREAKSAARLNHPNIVTLYDFGETADGYYMTLEYVAGRNLRQFVRKEEPDDETLRGVLIGICNGLQYAHSRKVIHRDIKPSNVLVSSIDLKA
ncbi:MAG: protein kinase domain-containing protein, partial [Planctomycetota bacterium]